MKLLLFLLLVQNTLTWRFMPLKKKIYKKNKKFISINPAGMYGFYTLGVSSYIKDNYNLSKYHFIGASSGSWNCLLCCYKYNQKELINNLLRQDFLENPDSLNHLQVNLYNYILKNYISEDFNLDKLYICISEFNNFELKNIVISNFTNLEQALECCILSCHIPFITSSNFIKKYQNKIVFDGGLTEFPPKNISNYFTISPNKYNNKNLEEVFFELIIKNVSINVINDLYYEGYKEASNDKIEIDKYFGEEDFPFYLDYL